MHLALSKRHRQPACLSKPLNTLRQYASLAGIATIPPGRPGGFIFCSGCRCQVSHERLGTYESSKPNLCIYRSRSGNGAAWDLRPASLVQVSAWRTESCLFHDHWADVFAVAAVDHPGSPLAWPVSRYSRLGFAEYLNFLVHADEKS